MKTIVLEQRAARQLDKQPEHVRTQIVEELARFAISGIGDVKKLTGQEEWRLQIGRFRVIFLR